MTCLKHSVLQLSAWLWWALSVSNPVSFDLSSVVASHPITGTHVPICETGALSDHDKAQ